MAKLASFYDKYSLIFTLAPEVFDKICPWELVQKFQFLKTFAFSPIATFKMEG